MPEPKQIASEQTAIALLHLGWQSVEAAAWMLCTSADDTGPGDPRPGTQVAPGLRRALQACDVIQEAILLEPPVIDTDDVIVSTHLASYMEARVCGDSDPRLAASVAAQNLAARWADTADADIGELLGRRLADYRSRYDVRVGAGPD